MPLLKILTLPNPILRKKSKEIKPEEIAAKEFNSLVSAMKKTLLKTDGVGLAAPQIGKNIRLTVINTKDGLVSLINPKIIKKSWAAELGQEGCLSIPGVYGKVKRPKKITINYLNQEGKKIRLNAEGMMARVIQHEIDHLDGILIIDKAIEIKKEESASADK